MDIGNAERGSVEWQVRISAKPGEPEGRWLEEDLNKVNHVKISGTA